MGLPAGIKCALAGDLRTHEIDKRTWDTGRAVGQIEVGSEGIHECVRL